MVSRKPIFNCKVFSNEALFCSADRLPRRTTDLSSSSVLPLSAVVLLNSPAAGAWEWSEYKRLHSLYRQNKPCRDISDSSLPSAEERRNILPCYFICADGAYSSLQKGLAWDDASSGTHDPKENIVDGPTRERERVAVGNSRLHTWIPDVVIGDMDSCDATDIPVLHMQENKRGDREKPSLDDGGPTSYRFPSVDEIPEHVLEQIRERAIVASVAAITNTGGGGFSLSLSPVFLHIECQMTTDFQKVMSLLARLEKMFPQDFPRLTREPASLTKGNMRVPGPTCEEFVLTSDQSVSASSLSRHYSDVQQKLLSTIDERSAGAWGDVAPKEEIQKERERVTSLLQEVHQVRISSTEPNRCPSTLEDTHLGIRSHLLPQIAVFGALGGRFDHEMGAISCVVEYSHLFHIALTNRCNIISACWTDGLTQWFPYNESTTTLDSETEGEDSFYSSTLLGQNERKEGCGIIPMGTVKEMETTGLLYNVVKGRANRCDAVTQTNGYRFAFGALLSVCNTVADPIVTVDLRPLHRPPQKNDSSSALPEGCGNNNYSISNEMELSITEKDEDSYNPPTIISCSRQ